MGPPIEALAVAINFSSTTALAEWIFDHVILHKESYARKWEYVRENPVRAGFVEDANQWLWQGKLVRPEAP